MWRLYYYLEMLRRSISATTFFNDVKMNLLIALCKKFIFSQASKLKMKLKIELTCIFHSLVKWFIQLQKRYKNSTCWRDQPVGYGMQWWKLLIFHFVTQSVPNRGQNRYITRKLHTYSIPQFRLFRVLWFAETSVYGPGFHSISHVVS